MTDNLNEPNISIIEAYKIIKSKQFDKEKVSKTPYYSWDGIETVDYFDIMRLFYSYEFKNMKERTGIKKLLIGEDIKIYQKFKNFQNRLLMILSISLIVLVLSIVLFFNDYMTNYYFYFIVISLYLININFPRFIKKKLRQNRRIRLNY